MERYKTRAEMNWEVYVGPDGREEERKGPRERFIHLWGKWTFPNYKMM